MMTDQEFREVVVQELRDLSGKFERLEQKLDLQIQNTEGKMKGHFELLQKDMLNVRHETQKHEAESHVMIDRFRKDIDELYNIDRSCKADCGTNRGAIMAAMGTADKALDDRIDAIADRVKTLEASAKTLGWALGALVAVATVVAAFIAL